MISLSLVDSDDDSDDDYDDDSLLEPIRGASSSESSADDEPLPLLLPLFGGAEQPTPSSPGCLSVLGFFKHPDYRATLVHLSPSDPDPDSASPTTSCAKSSESSSEDNMMAAPAL